MWAGAGSVLAPRPPVSLLPHTLQLQTHLQPVHPAGLLAAVQQVVPDMASRPGSAILVTGGGLSLAAENRALAKAANAMGGVAVAAGKAAQRALVHSLAEGLAPKVGGAGIVNPPTS